MRKTNKVKELRFFQGHVDGLVYLNLEADGLGTGDSDMTKNPVSVHKS